LQSATVTTIDHRRELGVKAVFQTAADVAEVGTNRSTSSLFRYGKNSGNSVHAAAHVVTFTRYYTFAQFSWDRRLRSIAQVKSRSGRDTWLTFWNFGHRARKSSAGMTSDFQ